MFTTVGKLAALTALRNHRHDPLTMTQAQEAVKAVVRGSYPAWLMRDTLTASGFSEADIDTLVTNAYP